MAEQGKCTEQLAKRSPDLLNRIIKMKNIEVNLEDTNMIPPGRKGVYKTLFYQKVFIRYCKFYLRIRKQHCEEH